MMKINKKVVATGVCGIALLGVLGGTVYENNQKTQKADAQEHHSTKVEMSHSLDHSQKRVLKLKKHSAKKNDNSSSKSSVISSKNQNNATQQVKNTQQPSNAKVYRANFGDTLSGIAQENGTTVDALVKANPQIVNPNDIYVGQPIVIPDGKASTTQDTYYHTQSNQRPASHMNVDSNGNAHVQPMHSNNTGSTATGNTETNTGANTGSTATGNTETNTGANAGSTATGNTETNTGANTGSTATGNTETNTGANTGSHVAGNTETNTGANTGSHVAGNTETNTGTNVGSHVAGNTETNTGTNVGSHVAGNTETSTGANVGSTANNSSSANTSVSGSVNTGSTQTPSASSQQTASSVSSSEQPVASSSATQGSESSTSQATGSNASSASQQTPSVSSNSQQTGVSSSSQQKQPVISSSASSAQDTLSSASSTATQTPSVSSSSQQTGVSSSTAQGSVSSSSQQSTTSSSSSQQPTSSASSASQSSATSSSQSSASSSSQSSASSSSQQKTVDGYTLDNMPLSVFNDKNNLNAINNTFSGDAIENYFNNHIGKGNMTWDEAQQAQQNGQVTSAILAWNGQMLPTEFNPNDNSANNQLVNNEMMYSWRNALPTDYLNNDSQKAQINKKYGDTDSNDVENATQQQALNDYCLSLINKYRESQGLSDATTDNTISQVTLNRANSYSASDLDHTGHPEGYSECLGGGISNGSSSMFDMMDSSYRAIYNMIFNDQSNNNEHRDILLNSSKLAFATRKLSDGSVILIVEGQ